MKASGLSKMTTVARAKEYLAHRRGLGFEFDASSYVLLDFARFADRAGSRGPLTTELILRWATQSDQHSRKTQVERLSIARGFARFLAAHDGESQVPDMRLLGIRCPRQQPHLYTVEQLCQLLAAAADLRPIYPLRPYVYETLFGLLASTGLRISEALALRRSDVDLESGVLLVRLTKFRKSRLVPVHETVTDALRRFAARRDRDRGIRATEWFFVGRNGNPLPYRTVCSTFGAIRRRLGWRSNGTLPLPRIHDMRHSFACRRLAEWYRTGVDVDHAIASLSTYLGHRKVTDTYWYLSASGELLGLASDRFERFVSPGRSGP